MKSSVSFRLRFVFCGALCFAVSPIVFAGCSRQSAVTPTGAVTGVSERGAAAGTIAGSEIINPEDSLEDQLAAQEEVMRRQKGLIERQERELEDLRRQRYHNESFQRFAK